MRVDCHITPRGSIIRCHVLSNIGESITLAKLIAIPYIHTGLYDDQEDDGRYSDIVEHPFSGIIWRRPVRKLVNQSHGNRLHITHILLHVCVSFASGFFMKLQNLCSVNKAVEPKMILEYSKRFRSAMKECVMDLKKEQDNQGTHVCIYMYSGWCYLCINRCWRYY